MNWINKLNDSEMTELFCHINKFKPDEIRLEYRKDDTVCFLEKWGMADECEWLKTYYTFQEDGFSFDSGDVHVRWEEKRRLLEWMIKRFGKEYVVDLLHYMTGLKIDLEVLK